MTLTARCQDCRLPVIVLIPDTASEASAQAIAGRLYCSRCGIRRMIQTTRAGAATGAAKRSTAAIAMKGLPGGGGS